MPKQCPSSAQAVLEQSGSHVVASSMLCAERAGGGVISRYFGLLDHGRAKRRDEVVSGSERDTVKQGEQRRPEAGRRPKMTDNPIRPPETRHVSQVARCGAKTRSGAPCKSVPVTGRRRCRMHGGADGSGAPEGSKNGNYKHGRYTKEHKP